MSGNTTSKETSTRNIGRVKWFNTKSGFGFITVTDGPKSGSDIFAHHSAIVVDDEQYRYLVQGEYVEFEICDSTSDSHDFQAENISGINGGKLMCETRRDTRLARTQYRHQDRDDGECEWTTVVKNGEKQPPAQRQPREKQPPAQKQQKPRAKQPQAKMSE